MSVPAPGPFPEVPLFPRSAQGALSVVLVVLSLLLGLRMWSLSNRANRPLDIQPTYRVDLNRASLAELELLPGLGRTLAQRVREHREKAGGFREVSELLDIKGIGPLVFELLQDRVTIGAFEDVTKIPAGDVNPNAPPGRIDPNRATLEELKRLPGIGPVLAERIVQSRTAQPFKSVDDLRRVKGIGPKTLEAVRPLVHVETSQQ